MAIRFDDRIETNVSGDVLITGDQIKIDDNNRTTKLFISSDDVYINNKTFHIDECNVLVDKLVELPSAINEINEYIINITTRIVDFVSTNNQKINIDTTTKYFGDKIKISSANELENYILDISTNLKEGPLITFLSSPIVFSTNLNNGNIIYGTLEHPFDNPNIKMLPKNTLVYLFSTDTHLDKVKGIDALGISTYVQVMLLKNFMKILSIPISADDIHNDFETRIDNIEKLLALKQ